MSQTAPSPERLPSVSLSYEAAADLRQWLEQAAMTLGFCAIGFLPVSSLKQQDAERLESWLAQGHHADMDWMLEQAELRREPEHLVPGAETIVVLLHNYYQPNPEAPPGSKIARYAWGKDYHKVIKKKLKTLLLQLKTKHPEAAGRGFTDSAPIQEKTLAEQAGLGWQGKNTLLLNKDYGSWTFIASLFINLPLCNESEPFSKKSGLPNEATHSCGTCTRCLDACPTEAFPEPFVLDANRCIAYWTIENRSSKDLPVFITEHLEAWLFGCDICQDVCPWNIKFATPHEEPAFSARLDLLNLSPEDWLAMDERSFEELVINSPLRRTGLETLKRNARMILRQAKS